MKISVYGSAAGSSETVKENARKIGQQIAIKGCILITGACPGIPYEAVLAAREKNGETIGFSPWKNEEEPTLQAINIVEPTPHEIFELFLCLHSIKGTHNILIERPKFAEIEPRSRTFAFGIIAP